jgi:D-sedoheptulose 7-phosphate isomerase
MKAPIKKFIQAAITTLKAKGTIFACGNGGSLCEANHLAQELTGHFQMRRRPLGAIALTDASQITCIANDFGFKSVFSRPLEALGKKGDLLVAISTSGNSINVIKAVETAKSKGIKTVGLLGKGGGDLKDLVDIPIVVASSNTARIQEAHMKIIHTVIEAIEKGLCRKHLIPNLEV